MFDINIAFITLIWELMNHKTENVGRVSFVPQKPSFPLDESKKTDLPRALPEEEGVSSADLYAFVKDLSMDEKAHIHQLMVVRHGKVIFETAFDPYVRGVWHYAYSMSKSAAVIAVGILYDEGQISLDDRVIDYFPEEWSPVSGIRFSSMTVRDLLIMSSGSSFNEVGAISGNDWVKGFFSSSLKFVPGSRFDYNSMNTFVLSAIVSKCTGMDLFSFLKLRAFPIMGIREVFWESSPAGITKGGWGLFIKTEDAVKIGLLFMNGGVYNGIRILSEEFVKMATSPQIGTDMPYSPLYGMQIWMDHREGSFMFNGMLGQNVHCYPDLDMIIAVNGGHDSVFQKSSVTDLIRTHFGDGFRILSGDADPAAARSDQAKLAALKERCEGSALSSMPAVPVKGGWKRRYIPGTGTLPDPVLFFRSIAGNTYELQEKGIGVMPLMMQVIHNNYTRGISLIRFRTLKRTVYMDVLEGPETFSIPVGFGKGRHASLDFMGETYLIGTKGRLSRDEDGRTVLSLRICFIEEACERLIRIVFEKDGNTRLYFDETPGSEMIAKTLEKIAPGSSSTSPIMNSILAQISPELVRTAVRTGISPVARGILRER